MALTADVVVVGGGMAGVSIAAELAASARVVLLEAEPALAHHTTGRSAAAFITSYGAPVVRALTRASRRAYDEAPEALGTPVLLTPRPMLLVAREDQRALLETELTIEGLEAVSVDDALALCPGLDLDYVVAAAVEPSAMDVDVMALHQGYLSRLRSLGGTVVREARVSELRRLNGGWRVTAGETVVEAPVVVNAAGAWADQVAMLAGVGHLGLTPMRRTIASCSVDWPGGGVGSWPLVVDVAEEFYLKPEGSGDVLVSPADETLSDPTDARPREEDVALGIERVNAATRLGLRHVRTAWAGLRTFAPDRLPVVGPDPRAEGFVWFAGQGGYGIQMAPALAMVGAALTLGAAVPSDMAEHGVDAGQLAVDRLLG